MAALLIYYVRSKAMLANRYAAVEGLMVIIHPGCGVWADLKALLQSCDVSCWFSFLLLLFFSVKLLRGSL